jgi:hypothetical protein
MDAGARAEAERAGQDPDAFLAETVAQEPAAAARADALVAAALLLAEGDDPPEPPAVLAEAPSAVLDGPDDLAEQ